MEERAYSLSSIKKRKHGASGSKKQQHGARVIEENEVELRDGSVVCTR